MRIVFMGSPEFAVPALRALLGRHEVVLVVSQPDKPAGRGRKLTAPPVKVVADEAGIAVIQPRSARSAEFCEQLRAAQPDVCVVVAYGKILPAPVLSVARHGCLNIHASLLPRYRGAAPIQWAVINGEAETGITIMRLDEGMDTGPMLLSRAVPILDDDTAGTLHDRLAPLGAELLVEALAGLEAGTLAQMPQDHGAATYAPMLKKADGVVDWNKPARAVRDHIRGMDPWPGAVTGYRGSSLRLFAVRLSAGSGAPGAVLAADDRGVRVACGEGAISVGELQVAGKRRLPAASFLAGNPIGPGDRLGE
jgi:methionyl-tRNA formyltransferase